MDDSLNLDFDTLAVRAGTARSDFNEHSEAIFLTSSFVFASAADAAERFKHSADYFTYSRFTNPTVSMFQDRLARSKAARPASRPRRAWPRSSRS
jgi:O-succinylhomoserine sulfhydrylase